MDLDGYISTINGFNFSGNGDRIGTVIVDTAMKQIRLKILGMDNPNGSQRYYIGHVNWTGFNGLVEYTGSDQVLGCTSIWYI